MDLKIEIISDKSKELVTIECVEITPEVEEIKSFILSKERFITGRSGDRMSRLSVCDILYFESVDDRVFGYTENAEYEIKSRLYELEKEYAGCGFIRCSKSVLLNIYATESFSPALNGRFFAHLAGGEKVIVSRQYVADFKKAVLEGR